MIDFVIPLHKKDLEIVKISVDNIKKNISYVNNIYIISDFDFNIPNTIHIGCGYKTNYENMISLDNIKKIWQKKNLNFFWRSEWIYQQILKLLAGRAIPQLTKSFVIVDADTIFLRNIDFNIEKFYYTSSTEKYYLPHVNSTKKLLNLKDTIGFTVTAHHGIYNKEKLEEMLILIEKNFNMTFGNAILNVLDYNEGSSLNEQDLYANYMILNYPEMCMFRDLRWLNINFIPDQKYLDIAKEKYDFVSCHSYLRK